MLAREHGRMRGRWIAALAGAGAVAAAGLPAAAQAADRTVQCQGGANRCVATVPLEGAATGDRIIVELTDTDLELQSIVPSEPSLTASYGFAGFSTQMGGSEFVAKLVITGPIPAGASIAMTFAVPPRMRDCGNLRFRIDGAPIRLRDVQARGLGCKPAKRIARRCVSGRGPGGSGWTIFEVDDRVTLSRRAQRVAFTLGNVRQSCAPSG